MNGIAQFLKALLSKTIDKFKAKNPTVFFWIASLLLALYQTLNNAVINGQFKDVVLIDLPLLGEIRLVSGLFVVLLTVLGASTPNPEVKRALDYYKSKNKNNLIK